MKPRAELLILFFLSLSVQAVEPTIDELSTLSLEELMSLELVVTSAAKKPQKVADAAAAIYVLTNKDIHRSGAKTLAEVLRLVPGVHVARINAHKWAVSVRGFNSQFSSKLQVLIDGRSIYSHLVANVIWDTHNPLLDDIERIEVIRGSGSSLWGANAMNGVINIITKHSRDTQGNLLITGGGNEEKLFGAFRHGGKINDDSYYKFYGKFYERDSGDSLNGAKTNDLSRGFQGGFRSDIKLTERNQITLQGDYFEGEEEENLTSELLPKQAIDTKPKQINILGRWQHTGIQGDELALQFYFNREEWDNDITSPALPDFHIDTYDIDFQHRLNLFENNEVTWGLGYRLIVDSFENSVLTTFRQKHRKIPLYSGFIQDEITLIPGFWRLIVGSKFEHNDFTGFEFQPTIRTIFKWTNHTFWGAISRSTRTPSRSEDGIINNTGIANSPLTVRFINASNLKSEELTSFEIGYRFKFSERLNFDLTAYYNDYDHLVESNSTTLAFPTLIVDAAYTGDATTMGFEAAMDWHPSDTFTLKLTYTYLDDKNTFLPSGNSSETSPHHQASLFTAYQISPLLEFDMTTRVVDQVDGYNIDSYVGIDMRLAFKPYKGLELSVVGQNLFDSHHPEFGEKSSETTPTEIERSLYGQLSWKF